MESAGGYAGRQRINTFVIRGQSRGNTNVIIDNMIWRTLMRTWLASLAFQGRGTARLAGVIRFAGVRTLSALTGLFTVGVGTAMAHPAANRNPVLHFRPRLRLGYLHAAQEPAGTPGDAGDLGADLRDLQDLSGDAGQVHPGAVGVHRSDHRCIFRLAGTRAG